MEWNKLFIPLFEYLKMKQKKVFTTLFGNTMEGDGVLRKEY